MTIIQEEDLSFAFDSDWHVIKYDEHPDYQVMERLDSTKGVDFVAVRAARPSRLVLIEIKDFHEHRIENKGKLKTGNLAIEIGQKVRDTLAGVVAAHRRGSGEDWAPIVPHLFDRNLPSIQVVLWLENDEEPPGRPPGRAKQERSIFVDMLKGKLGWLTSRIFVSSMNDNVIPGLKVSHRPDLNPKRNTTR